MAAATVTKSTSIPDVFGANRVLFSDSIVFANTGDTWTVPGMKRVKAICLTPTTNASFGFTKSANVITLTAGAGLTFTGCVIGL